MNVFLSFSSADRKIAAKLRAELVRRGLDVQSDDQALEPGAEWRRHLEKAIGSADMIVVLVSPKGPDEAQQFSWQEVLAAVWQNPSKKIGALLLGSTEVPVPAFFYSSKRPFIVLRIFDPQNLQEIESAAQAVADALTDAPARRGMTRGVLGGLGDSIHLPAGEPPSRGERLEEIQRYAEHLKERG
jgi:TIR domain